MYRIFIKGNLLIVQNTVTNEEMEGIASQVLIHRDFITSTSWRFKGLNGNITDAVPESQIVDENGDPYPDFNAWRAENTAGESDFSALATKEKQDEQTTVLDSINSKLAVPIHVIVDNQINLADITDELQSIISVLEGIEEETQPIEAKLTAVVNAIDTESTINHADLLAIIDDVDGLESDTLDIRNKLQSIITNTAVASTSANQVITNTKLDEVKAKLDIVSSYLDDLSLKVAISVNNNYNSTVGALSTVSGTAEDMNGHTAVICALLSNQDGILYMEFSTDGVTWQSSIPFKVTANTNEVHRFTRTRAYFRFRFENTTASVATVSLQTSFGQFAQLTSALNSVIQQDADANVARIIDTETLIGGSFLDGFSVTQKAGYNPDIDTGSIPEDVGGTGGVYTGFPDSTLETVNIISTSLLDASAGTGARTITIIGLDANYNVQQETITLNGNVVLGVNSTLQFRRVHTAFIATAGSGGANAGTITIRHSTTITNIFATMRIGTNQTNESAYTVPAGFTAYVDVLNVAISQGTAAASASGAFWTRAFGMPFRQRRPFVVSNNDRLTERIYGRVRFTEKSDIVVRINVVSNNNTEVTAGYDIILIRN